MLVYQAFFCKNTCTFLGINEPKIFSFVKVLIPEENLKEPRIMSDVRWINNVPIITRLNTQDADELEDLAQEHGWDEEYLQLKKGKFDMEICLIQVGDWQFIEQSCAAPILYRGSSPKKTLIISIPTLNREEIFCGGNTLKEGYSIIGNFAGYPDVRTNNQSRFLVIVAPLEQLLASAEQMQFPLIQKQLLSPGIIVSNLTAWKQLSNYLEELLAIAKSHPQLLTDNAQKTSMANLIVEDSVPLLLNVLTSQLNFLPKKESSRQNLVKCAEGYMRDRLFEPITLTDICQELDQSQRSLYYAFQEYFGLPPMKYLKILRLHGVRRTLKKAVPQTNTVSKIAMNYGFWHLGQFSADYKKMFGETPSTTLKQRELLTQ